MALPNRSNFSTFAERSTRRSGRLFDHLIGAGEQHRRHFEANRLGGLEVDHKLEFGGKRLALADLIKLTKRARGC
jgi:hypothetical protein